MEVEVRTLPHENTPAFAFSTEADELVSDLKRRLAERHQEWAAEGMNLAFEGRMLADDAQLRAYGIRSGDFVVLTGMRPRQLRDDDSAPPAQPQPVTLERF